MSRSGRHSAATSSGVAGASWLPKQPSAQKLRDTEEFQKWTINRALDNPMRIGWFLAVVPRPFRPHHATHCGIKEVGR